jgi:undecaprenyl diphosphate synthase
MDGNGRWARRRGERRTAGHLAGLQAAKRIVKAASDRGIRCLTLYTFSTENWKRTAEETGFIMGLVKQYLRKELDFYRENRIRLRHAGDPAGLPPDIAAEIQAVCGETKDFDGLQVVLALNYGGRDEIVRAVNRALSEAAAAENAENAGTGTAAESGRNAGTGGNAVVLTEADIARYLDNPDLPDPDLIIRSAGEMRTSNFLLWEGAYAEYYSSQALWPDWTERDLDAALEAYRGRDRKFGGVKP